MRARLDWNERMLVIESEAVRREAVGCIAWLGPNRFINRRRTLRYRGRAARAPRLPRSDRLSASGSTGERYIDVRPIHGEVFPHRQNYWRKRRCQLAHRQIPVVQA